MNISEQLEAEYNALGYFWQSASFIIINTLVFDELIKTDTSDIVMNYPCNGIHSITYKDIPVYRTLDIEGFKFIVR